MTYAPIVPLAGWLRTRGRARRRSVVMAPSTSSCVFILALLTLFNRGRCDCCYRFNHFLCMSTSENLLRFVSSYIATIIIIMYRDLRTYHTHLTWRFSIPVHKGIWYWFLHMQSLWCLLGDIESWRWNWGLYCSKSRWVPLWKIWNSWFLLKHFLNNHKEKEQQ